MKVILVDQRHGHTRTIVLKGWLKGLLSVCILGAPVALGYLGYQVAVSHDPQEYSLETALQWKEEIESQSDAVARLKLESEEQLKALTLRLAMLQAGLLRLEALGEPVTTVAELKAQIADRAQQLEILEGLMAERQYEADASLAGRPFNKGWNSAPFGHRTEPFNGQPAWRSGIDFATAEAMADIDSVVAGVMTAAGERQSQGLAVDIKHGNGYIARYGHAENLVVDAGEIIMKGQAIALDGSTAGSTGSHVHFDVYKHGRVIDPASYIHSTIR